MKELYLGVARSVETAQSRRGNSPKRWAPPSGEQIRKLRTRLGLSQSQFASQFGLDLNSLKNWEQDRSVPENSSRQIFWMIDANPDTAKELIEKASQHEKEMTNG